MQCRRELIAQKRLRNYDTFLVFVFVFFAGFFFRPFNPGSATSITSIISFAK
jgi:hypothetical protein